VITFLAGSGFAWFHPAGFLLRTEIKRFESKREIILEERKTRMAKSRPKE
jgi:hypothetical protein